MSYLAKAQRLTVNVFKARNLKTELVEHQYGSHINILVCTWLLFSTSGASDAYDERRTEAEAQEDIGEEEYEKPAVQRVTLVRSDQKFAVRHDSAG